MSKAAISCIYLILLIHFAALPSIGDSRGKSKEEKPRKPVGVIVHRPAQTLVAPPELRDATWFTIARVPCTLHFSVVEGCYPLSEDSAGLWSSWSESVLASDGNFYSAISNHQGVDGRSYIIRYEPETGRQTRVFDSHKLFAHEPGTYGHGKMHGRLDEYPEGFLVAATYWGMPPMITYYKGKRWTGSVPGGRLVQVNLETGTSRDLGVPFERDSWPMFATDTRRGIFYAVGFDKHFLAYDLNAERALYAALPQPTVEWGRRATLVDEETGNCYSTSLERFVKYDPTTNRISHLDVCAPSNPHREDMPYYTPGRNDNYYYLRCYTRRRTREGAFICQTFTGVIFKFFPDEESVETIDINWEQGCYCASMALSPGERYLYYTVDVHGSSFKHGTPVVQYDLRKKRKKVLAFLHPYYMDEHDYRLGGSFDVNLNDDGSKLFLTWNGKFGPKNETESFGVPTFMLIEIPASERVE